MDGFEVAVDDFVGDHVGEDFEDSLLVVGGHGEVGVFIVCGGEEALHLFALEFDEFFCRFFALSTDSHSSGIIIEGVEFFHFSFLQEFGHDFVFDGEAVAIPAGHEGDLVTHHVSGADDEVLEDFIEEVSEVD